MAAVDRKWAERIRAGDGRALARQFEHEVSELRSVAREHCGDVPRAWQDFRAFLADVGPSPGPAFRLQKVDPGRPLDGGNAHWAANRKATVEDIPARPPSSPGSSASDWTLMAGLGVDYADIPERFGVSFASLAAAVNGGVPLDDVLANLRKARDEVTSLGWFSENPQHQQAFRHAFLAWRLKVQPRHAGDATPRFLYLYMLLPTMAACRATLAEAGLWGPKTPSATFERDEHPGWRRFNELLPKATAIVRGFESYRQYSLIDDIDELAVRITAAELRLRDYGAATERSAA